MHDATYSVYLWMLLASLGKIQIKQNLSFASGNKIRNKNNIVYLATPLKDPVENCPLSGTVDLDVQAKSEFRQVVIETVPSNSDSSTERQVGGQDWTGQVGVRGGIVCH